MNERRIIRNLIGGIGGMTVGLMTTMFFETWVVRIPLIIIYAAIQAPIVVAMFPDKKQICSLYRRTAAPFFHLMGKYMRKLTKIIGCIGLATTFLSPVYAADLAYKANPFAAPYDLTKAGAYFGAGFGGSESTINGAAGGTVIPGTQIVQGSIFGTIGYGAPINAATGSFWFAEAQFGIQNLNGNTNGFSLSGPATFTQRFGAGTPLNQMLGSILPTGTGSPAVPTLPVLPAGVTAGPGAPYAFFALHEDDISNQVGLAQNRQWLLSYGVGIGLRYRLSNLVVADTYAEYKAASNTICAGPLGVAGCSHIGPGARVGVQFLY